MKHFTQTGSYRLPAPPLPDAACIPIDDIEEEIAAIDRELRRISEDRAALITARRALIVHRTDPF